jgi:chitinase
LRICDTDLGEEKGVMSSFGRNSWCILVLASVLLLSCLADTAVAKRTGELTVFWGRNKEEGTLREACDTGLYNTVIISFYSVFGHGRYALDLSGHPLDGVGADIKHCQSLGIPVFLSIGGGGNHYSIPSSASAEAVADNLWNAFLGGGNSDVPRPFGDAAVNGIDFYIDDHGAPGDHYDELARRLDYFNSMYYHATTKHVRLTATPRCAFPPDGPMARALRTGLFERIHVRFYGDADKCSYKNGDVSGVVDQWSKWTARYPKSQLYVGLAAAESGVPDHAPPPVEVYLKYLYYDLLPKVQKAPNYGGVMVWNRFTDNRTGYSGAVKGWAACSYAGCVN